MTKQKYCEVFMLPDGIKILIIRHQGKLWRIINGTKNAWDARTPAQENTERLTKIGLSALTYDWLGIPMEDTE